MRRLDDWLVIGDDGSKTRLLLDSCNIMRGCSLQGNRLASNRSRAGRSNAVTEEAWNTLASRELWTRNFCKKPARREHADATANSQ